jgi:hypothetical protein
MDHSLFPRHAGRHPDTHRPTPGHHTRAPTPTLLHLSEIVHESVRSVPPSPVPISVNVECHAGPLWQLEFFGNKHASAKLSLRFCFPASRPAPFARSTCEETQVRPVGATARTSTPPSCRGSLATSGGPEQLGMNGNSFTTQPSVRLLHSAVAGAASPTGASAPPTAPLRNTNQ